MKGVILRESPACRIIDLVHAITPQSVREASFLLARTAIAFPVDTIHLFVIDPGVGTARNILAAEIGDWKFVGPDNGVLTGLLEAYPLHSAVGIDPQRVSGGRVSPTFHGRDIMAPAAAQLAGGKALDDLGRPLDEPVRLDLVRPQVRGELVIGCVVWIDRFGNLVTNISNELLPESGRENVQVTLENVRVEGLCRTYGDAAPGEFVAYCGSGGSLEIGLVNGNAAQELGAQPGHPVSVQIPRSPGDPEPPPVG